MQLFKARASAAFHIMPGPRGNLREWQESNKTYLDKWLLDQIYQRKKAVESKYLEKGIIVEDQSIEFASERLKLGMVFKNEESKETEYITGTADLVLPNEVIDIKNSWDYTTFPLFETKIPLIYWWQLQCYMYLYEKPKARLVYTLTDTPVHLIDDEIRRQGWKQGFIDPPEEFQREIERNMVYTDIPDSLKIKVFELERDETAINNLIERVKLAREYIDTKLKSIL